MMKFPLNLITLVRAAAQCLLLATLTSPASANQTETEAEPPPLQPLVVSYKASMEKGVSLNGDARRTLQPRGDGTWLYRTDVDSFIADLDESLIFRWHHGRVVPLRYRYRLSGLLIKDRKQAIDFDWKNQLATGHYRGKQFSLPLEPGTLDPMGFQLQLRSDIKAGETDMSYRVIDRGRYDTDRFAVIAEEVLDKNGKGVAAVKAEKVRSGDSNRTTLMWFATDRDYLMVRLLQIEPDGSEYEIIVDQAQLTN